MNEHAANSLEFSPAKNSECGSCGYLIRTSSPNCPECGERIGRKPFQLKSLILGVGVDTYAAFILAVVFFASETLFAAFQISAHCQSSAATHAAARTYFLVWSSVSAILLIAFCVAWFATLLRRIIGWNWHFARCRFTATKISFACLLASCLIVVAPGSPIAILDIAFSRFFEY